MKDEKQNIIVEDMPDAEYRKHPAISQSDLKNLAKAPLYYKYKKENPSADTPALKTGRMIHTYILEQDKFEKEYFVTEKVSRATKVGKEAFAIAQEKANGREIIWNQDIEAAKKMKEMVMKLEVNTGTEENPKIVKLFEALNKKASKEISIFWQDPDTGIDCKGRIDGYSEYWNVLFDLKTTQDCLDGAFKRSFFKYRYHIQAAFYMDGIKELTGKTPEGFMIFALEKEEPYLCKSHYTDFNAEAIEIGRKEYKYLLNLYSKCESKNSFNEAFEKEMGEIEFVPPWYSKLTPEEF